MKLLAVTKQYRVTSPKSAAIFFKNYMDAGFGDRGLAIRFVEIPERCAIELSAHDLGPFNQMLRAFKDAKIIKHEIKFELNKVIKMVAGRREGRDFV